MALLLAVMSIQGYRVATLSPAKIASWGVVIDDGFYYLQTARNIARGHGATFDRINRTSGFQPLWTAMLVPVFWLSDDAGKGLQVALGLALALSVLAVALLYLGLRPLAGTAPALLACGLVVANPYFLQVLQGGLETPALFVCLCGLLAWWSRRREQVLAGQRRACLIFGSLVGLTILARVDVALMLAPLGLALSLWPSPRRGARLQRLLWTALPCALLLGLFVCWNLATQGHFVPTSGLVKKWVTTHYTGTWQLFQSTEQWRGLTRTQMFLAWPRTIREPQLHEILSQLRLPAALLLLLALRLLWSRAARKNWSATVLLGAGALGVAGHGAYIFFVYRCARYWDYHYFFPFALLQTLMLALLVALLVADAGRAVVFFLGPRARPAVWIAGALICGVALGWLLQRGGVDAELRMQKISKPAQQSFRHCRYAGGKYIRERLPKDAVVGSWWAGILGYFADRQVVNLDGVINSAEFLELYLKPEKVPRYIRKGPITHLADFFWRDPLHPAFGPCPRVKWWECEKAHVVRGMRDELQRVHIVPFRGLSGVHIMKVKKK